MRTFLLFSFLTFFIILSGCASRNDDEPATAGADISLQYLERAREYREQGRYDLARQTYAEALATCRNNETLAIIERELAGTELLIRNLR